MPETDNTEHNRRVDIDVLRRGARNPRRHFGLHEGKEGRHQRRNDRPDGRNIVQHEDKRGKEERILHAEQQQGRIGQRRDQGRDDRLGPEIGLDTLAGRVTDLAYLAALLEFRKDIVQLPGPAGLGDEQEGNIDEDHDQVARQVARRIRDCRKEALALLIEQEMGQRRRIAHIEQAIGIPDQRVDLFLILGRIAPEL